MTNSKLLINLAVLMQRPTGISTYSLNLLPHLKNLSPTLLLNPENFPTLQTQYHCYSIPGGQTPEQGAKGHLKRLLWTQFKLGKIAQTLNSKLIFSPLPEAPLGQNCNFIVMVHDLIPLRFPEKHSPMTYYCRYYLPPVLHQAQHILCNSQATATDIINFCQIPASKITPIHLACDTNHFQYLQLPTQNYFLYIGRSAPYKNLHRLIAAFANLPQTLECELWLAGTSDPRYTPSLLAQVQELDITHRVKFLDYVPYEQLPILINQAIALVYPSLWEGFGLPILEAMACGTPVITSNLSSLAEIAQDSAILVNPYAVEEITQALQSVAQDETMRSHLRQASLNRTHSFSWEKTGTQTQHLLESFISANS